MKMKALILIPYSICLTSNFTHAAADSSLSASPGGSWTEFFYNKASAGIGWFEKKTGTKPISYCIDKTAQQLLESTEQSIELSLADNRSKRQTNTYDQLIKKPLFQASLERLNSRAYFEWEHIKTAIQEERHQDVAQFWKHNRINLSPCLRVAIRLFLAQMQDRRKLAINPKEDIPRFDLSKLTYEPGFIEATLPIIEQESASFPELTKTIRERSESLSISSPILGAERRIRKTFDSSFSLNYLTSASEVEKAQHIYAVYFAHLFHTILMKNSISELFKNPQFLNVFNQAWDRDSHLRYTLQDQLKRGSLDACTIYVNHKKNISPLYATLVCDMILSHEQQTSAESVSPSYKQLFFGSKKPYEKYIFMFLNNLSKQQKINLFNAKETIRALPKTAHSTAIHQAVQANAAQLELLAEIESGNYTEQLLTFLEMAKITRQQYSLLEPTGSPSLILSQASSSSPIEQKTSSIELHTDYGYAIDSSERE